MEVLCLPSNGALGLAGIEMQNADALMNLKQLEINAPSVQDNITTTAFKMWFSWVLCRAQKLTVLSAQVERLEWFAPMMQLKHLVLRCSCAPGKIFAALPHAKSLQTLSLRAEGLSGGATVLDAPRLELKSLPDLRAVAFHGVCPDDTLLPKECGLHLAGLVTLDTIGDEKWSSALANLRSIDFVNNNLFLPQLPGPFGNVDMQNLSIVIMEFQDCGKANAPVSLAALAHVQQLCICVDREVYVTVPAKVSWQKLRLWGTDKLEVTFEDINAFATTVGSCSFSSINLAGTCLFQLCLALAERGIPWVPFKNENGAGAITLAFPATDAGEFSGCFCGACMECLRATGMAEGCPKDQDEDQEEEEEESPEEEGEEEDGE